MKKNKLLINNNNNNTNVLENAEQIKERIYQSLKTDISITKDKNEISALRKSLPNPKANGVKKRQQNQEVLNIAPAVTLTLTNGNDEKPLNLSTTPPSTPSVSVTPIEEEDDIRRSSRSCKGKRYQELKDEGKLGKKCRSRNDNEDECSKKIKLDVVVPVINPPINKPFNVTAKLNALPALSFEEYKQKIIKAKNNPISPRNTRSTLIRRKSSDSEIKKNRFN